MTTNLGTLPTPFTKNSVCSTEMDIVYEIWNSLDHYLLQGPPLSIARCMPDNYIESKDHFYRPATACPSGYTQACTSTAVIATLTDTYVTCCPTQHHYTCQGIFEKPWQSTLGCASNMPATTWTTSAIQVSLATTYHTTLTNAGGAMNAYSVQIRYGAADATSTTSSTTAASTLSTTPTTTATPTPTTTDTHSSSGLSTGAAVGIGVGCAVAGLAIAAAAVFIFLRKRRQRRDQAGVQTPAPYQPKVEPQYTTTTAELPGYLSGPSRP
ncbi:hypothetical protein PG997_014221 [Apiospora hydei]|uniref:Uncharacterized protein n=1 Tax=Apiospora hydei TaxID=1337664 RepID=A0ABR1UT64_9PEZI